MLDEGSVLPYLASRGLIKGNATVEVLTGGVSCVVLAISSAALDLVLKQALPELKTKIKWEADQRRAIVEAAAMSVYHSITPESVPKLLDCDAEQFTLTMTRLPRSTTNWKIDLLEGRVFPEMGAKLGVILAAWHNTSAKSLAIKSKFMEDALFEQLRVTPFYRAVLDKNSNLQPVITDLIDEITSEKITLVHGDFSPKNIMSTVDHSPVVLDFEVAHTGNPVFDLAFLSAHLLCKAVRTESISEKSLLIETALNFLNSYESHSELPIALTLPHHIALIALARVEGVSPVNYLSPIAQARVASLCKAALLRSEITWRELFESVAK